MSEQLLAVVIVANMVVPFFLVHRAPMTKYSETSTTCFPGYLPPEFQTGPNLGNDSPSTNIQQDASIQITPLYGWISQRVGNSRTSRIGSSHLQRVLIPTKQTVLVKSINLRSIYTIVILETTTTHDRITY